MKRNIAMKWAKYLETPGLKQAIGILDAGKGSRCCLGHLCHLLGVKKTHLNNQIGWLYDGQMIVLPTSVMKLTNMRTPVGKYLGGQLAEANDIGIPLPLIAKIIRKHYKEL